MPFHRRINTHPCCWQRPTLRPIGRMSASAVKCAALTSLLLVAATAPALAAAGVGVGISANPIELAAPISPARSAALPALYVKNTGSREATYRIRVLNIGVPKGHDVPAAWVHIATPTITLAAGKGSWIELGLTVPPNAPPGHYTSDLVAGSTFGATHTGQTARFGDQAAAAMSFTVAAPAARHRAFHLPGHWWAWLTGLAVLVFAVGWRHSGLRLRIERG